jgi:hypothetical protein
MSEDGSCHNAPKTSLAELPTPMFPANNEIKERAEHRAAQSLRAFRNNKG